MATQPARVLATGATGSTGGALIDADFDDRAAVTAAPTGAASAYLGITRLPGRDPAHARYARRRTRALLAAWGLGEQASLGELIVSELLANAVCHGETPIWMRLWFGGGDLRVEVHDGAAGRPVSKHTDSGDECGRGLELLDGLIELHGGERGVVSDQSGPGKTVYVVLSLEITQAGAQ